STRYFFHNAVIPSGPFLIFLGCRQGDGLSSMLYILLIEPLALPLRQNVIASLILIKSSSYIQNSISSLLSIFEEFKLLSGYKINWTKSALMLLNEVAKIVSLPSTIPMKTQFTYLGIGIQTSLHGLVKFTYEKMYKGKCNGRLALPHMCIYHQHTSVHGSKSWENVSLLLRNASIREHINKIAEQTMQCSHICSHHSPMGPMGIKLIQT
uniref:Reverse transcriptase domain-containing protein n=1 Tax=Oncorhynchus mykiss TaxID=8022 RepID=A0A8K9WW35_ONCMY